LRYVNDFKVLNSEDAIDYRIPIDQSFLIFTQRALGNVQKLSKEKIIIKLTKFVRKKMYHQKNIISSLDQFVQSGKVAGICSGYSKFFACLCQALGYQARVIWLQNHTVSEVYFPDQGWVMVDTYGNVIFKNEQGKLCSLIEIYLKGPGGMKAQRIVSSDADDDLDYLISGTLQAFYDSENIITLRGRHLFDFAYRSKCPQNIFNYFFFNHPIAVGLQFVSRKSSRKFGNKRELVIFLAIINIIIITFIIVARKLWRYRNYHYP
jgi:hypothetical protein